MKTLISILGAMIMIAFAGTTYSEVEVIEAPLTWKQAALTDGEDLYMELCAVCHGTGGKGDGPAASALNKPATDLTLLAAGNDGAYPAKRVEKSITGKTRTPAHGTLDMPIWGQQFADLRPDWKQNRRQALARQRIYNLTLHIESLQAE